MEQSKKKKIQIFLTYTFEFYISVTDIIHSRKYTRIWMLGYRSHQQLSNQGVPLWRAPQQYNVQVQRFTY